jgi:hypothetical protein
MARRNKTIARQVAIEHLQRHVLPDLDVAYRLLLQTNTRPTVEDATNMGRAQVRLQSAMAMLRSCVDGLTLK